MRYLVALTNLALTLTSLASLLSLYALIHMLIPAAGGKDNSQSSTAALPLHRETVNGVWKCGKTSMFSVEHRYDAHRGHFVQLVLISPWLRPNSTQKWHVVLSNITTDGIYRTISMYSSNYFSGLLQCCHFYFQIKGRKLAVKRMLDIQVWVHPKQVSRLINFSVKLYEGE